MSETAEVYLGMRASHIDPTSNQHGVALIWGDGGIKGGFIAAAADEVVQFLREKNVAVRAMMASSASVGNMFYFLSSGYEHPGVRMWTEVLSRKTFLHFDGWKSLYRDRPIYDIDYLVEEIFKKEFPLNLAKIKEAEIELFFPVEDLDSGDIVYFSNRRSTRFIRDGKAIEIKYIFDYDIYQLIKAASAAPFIFDSYVTLSGRKFIDAASIEPFALDLPTILELPKIVILARQKPTMKSILGYISMTLFWCVAVLPFRQRKLKIRNYVNYALKPIRSLRRYRVLEKLEREGKAILITPTRKIGSSYDNSPETLRDNYLHGQEAARAAFGKIEKLTGVPATS